MYLLKEYNEYDDIELHVEKERLGESNWKPGMGSLRRT